MPPAIRCTNIHKTYPGKPPVEAVRGLDLLVEQGICFGLLGPNGAGKTTTIEIIEGLLPATSGEVEILGRNWQHANREIKERIGISFQETRLSEKLSVLETLTLFRSFYRRGLEPTEVLRRISLEEKAKAWVGKLSGGQKQRLAVACALVGDPDLLFLDEPTTGLDPQSRRDLWDVIRKFREQGRTVLLTTHYMDEAERLCDQIAIVDHGKVIALGSPAELIASLGGEHVIEFSVAPPADAGAAFSIDDAVAVGRFTSALDLDRLADLPAVSTVRHDNGQLALSVSEPRLAIPALVERLDRLNLRLASLTTRHASLEDVFVKLAGRHMREDQPEGTAA